MYVLHFSNEYSSVDTPRQTGRSVTLNDESVR